ncbi:MAG TPA: efflux RND transporter periplasmic adaptor subunit [Caulobacteraceae bacterium]|jgi:cobalt-zinc-cadmium efflux system membrane fusion protein
MAADPRNTVARRVAAALGAVAMVAAVAGCSSKADENQQAQVTPTNVKLTKAQLAHIQVFTVNDVAFHNLVDASGVVDFDNDQATQVLAAFSGPVTRIVVNPGDHVRKGQPLAYVQSADFAAAAGAYTKAVAAAKNARKIADTDQALLAHQGVSAKEAEQAQSDAVGAESDRDAALQALRAIDVDPGSIKALQEGRDVARLEGVIRAPLSGVVADKLVTPGMLLQAGTTPTFTVADLSKMWVMAQLSDKELSEVKVGDSASVVGNSTTQPFPGTVTNIASELDPNTRSVIARVQVDNPGSLLKRQMYVRVQIRSRDQTTGLLVPVSSVLHDDENLPFVYLMLADGSFARRGVTLGERNGDNYLVLSGLQPGDRIVNDGGIFLQFMQSQ